MTAVELRVGSNVVAGLRGLREFADGIKQTTAEARLMRTEFRDQAAEYKAIAQENVAATAKQVEALRAQIRVQQEVTTGYKRGSDERKISTQQEIDLQHKLQATLGETAAAARRSGAAQAEGAAGGGILKRDEKGFTRGFASRAGVPGAGLAAIAGPGFIAGVAGGLLIDQSVKAASEAQRSMAQLRNAIKDTGQQYTALSKNVESYTAVEEKKTGFEKSDVRQTLSQLIRSTGDLGKAEHDQAVMADIARARNTDLSGAMMLVLKASMGNVGALRRLGIDVQKVTTYEDKLREAHLSGNVELMKRAKAYDLAATKAEVMAQVTQRFAGSSAAYMKTYSGETDRLKNEWRDLEIEIGQKAIPILQATIGWILKEIDALKQSKTAHEILRVAVGLLKDAWVGIKTIFDVLKPAFEWLAGEFEHHRKLAIALAIVLGALFAPLIVSVPIVIGVIVKHWNGIVGFFKNLWAQIHAAFNLAWDEMKIGAVKAVLDIIEPFSHLPGDMGKWARNMKDNLHSNLLLMEADASKQGAIIGGNAGSQMFDNFKSYADAMANYRAKAVKDAITSNDPGMSVSTPTSTHVKFKPGSARPAGVGLSTGRTDMGVDYGGSGVILALDDGVVTYLGYEHGSGSSGGNGPFMIYRTAGGQYVYIAENWTPMVRKGDRIKRGDPIGRATGGGIEMGFAAGPSGNWNTAAAGIYHEGMQTPQGKAFLAFTKGGSGAVTTASTPTLPSAATFSQDIAAAQAAKAAAKAAKAAVPFHASVTQMKADVAGAAKSVNELAKTGTLPASLVGELEGRVRQVRAAIADAGGKKDLPALRRDLATLKKLISDGIRQATVDSDVKTNLKTIRDDLKDGLLTPQLANGLLAQGVRLSKQLAAKILDPIQLAQVDKNEKAWAAKIKEAVARATDIKNFRDQITAWHKQFQDSIDQGTGTVNVTVTPAQLSNAEAQAHAIILKLAAGVGDRKALEQQLGELQKTIQTGLDDAAATFNAAKTKFEGVWGNLTSAIDTQFSRITQTQVDAMNAATSAEVQRMTDAMNAHVQQMQDAATKAVSALQVKVRTSYGSFTYGGGVTQTPAEKELAALQQAHDDAQTQAQLAADQAAGDTKAVAEDLYNIQVAALQKRADAERTAADAQLKTAQDALQKQLDAQTAAYQKQQQAQIDAYQKQQDITVQAYQDQRTLEQQQMDAQLTEQETLLESGKEDYQTFSDNVSGILAQHGINAGNLSYLAGVNLVKGLQPGIAAAIQLWNDYAIAEQNALNGQTTPLPGDPKIGKPNVANAGGGHYRPQATAYGGVHLRPTVRMVGEQGPEATVPLTSQQGAAAMQQLAAGIVGALSGGGGGLGSILVTGNTFLGSDRQTAQAIARYTRPELNRFLSYKSKIG